MAEYTEEKLRQAIDALAASAAPIQRRLLSAALAILNLESSDFEDPKQRAQFSGLMDTLTSQDAEADEGKLQSTILRLSDEQAVAAAETIVGLYFGVTMMRG